MVCSAREIALQANKYRNGESQRALQVASSRRTWVLAVRLSASALATLRAFYLARRGGTEPPRNHPAGVRLRSLNEDHKYKLNNPLARLAGDSGTAGNSPGTPDQNSAPVKLMR